MITAYGSIEKAVEAMKNGAADFITKPFNKDVIRHVVHKLLKAEDLRTGERASSPGLPGARGHRAQPAPCGRSCELVEKVGRRPLRGPHPRGERRGQGGDRPGHPRKSRGEREGRFQRALRQHQLSGGSGHADRERAFRVQEGSVHRAHRRTSAGRSARRAAACSSWTRLPRSLFPRRPSSCGSSRRRSSSPWAAR